uniref:Uncharacterized protein n=1 Tax=Anguilla anguilla TaxID=7936 RepID=A0A0E9VX09_ANGAN
MNDLIKIRLYREATLAF